MAEDHIGRYRILEEIASGAQGTVYRAFDLDARRLVAVKVLHPRLTGDESYLMRFRREASLTASVNHPNVVRIFDVGQQGDLHYIALEFLPENLARLIEKEGLPVETAVAFAAQIADGLSAVDRLGIVHRDVKPENVLITPDGVPKVTDFGIARAEGFSTLTLAGMMMGTPHYMSPEQARGERADARSDIYALGCVLYEMLTGEVPFEAETPLAVLHKHIEEKPRSVRTLRADAPRAVAGVVATALAKDPADRFKSASEMAEALRAPVLESPQSAPPVPPSPTPPASWPTPKEVDEALGMAGPWARWRRLAIALAIGTGAGVIAVAILYAVLARPG